MPLAARCRKPHWLAGAPKLQQSFCSRLVCPSLTGSLGFPRAPRPMRHLTRRARRPHPLRMPSEVPKPHHRTSEVAPISTRCVRRGTPPRSAAQFFPVEDRFNVKRIGLVEKEYHFRATASGSLELTNAMSGLGRIRSLPESGRSHSAVDLNESGEVVGDVVPGNPLLARQHRRRRIQ